MEANNNVNQLEETSSNTRPVKYSFSHRWTIEDFSVILADTSSEYPMLKSARFSSPANPSIKFAIKLYPKGNTEDCKDYMSAFLYFVPSEGNEVVADFTICLVDSNGLKQRRHISKQKSFSSLHYSKGWKRFVPQSDLLNPENNLLFEDRLTVHCEVTVYDGTITYTLDPAKYRPSIEEAQVISKKQTLMNLSSLLKGDKQTDVTLVVGNGPNSKEIKAHKFVLVAGSSVFEAMFKYDTSEKQSGVVTLPDISPEVGELFIRYLYTGEVNQLETYAEELFVVADMYGTDLLKRMCVQSLCSQMNTSSVCQLLLLSDRHSSTELQQSCIEYITNHANEVIRNQDWQLMSQLNDTLKVELFRKLANKHPIDK